MTRDDLPLVSVVIGTYNRADLVTETLDSVLAQTYPNFEVVVVDDGSTDDTAEVIKKGYGNLVRYVYQENQGAGASRQTGIELARGELIAFQDDDELWLPTKLEKQVAALQAHPHCGFCYCKCLWADAEGNPTGDVCRRTAMGVTGDNFLAYLWRGVIHHASAVVRKECLDAIGGMDTSLRVSEDTDLYLRLTARFEGIYLSEPLVLIREHPGQKSVANWQARRTHRANTRILRKLLDDLPAKREPLRPSIQRRLAEFQLLGIRTTDRQWDDFVEDLVAANRDLSDFRPFPIEPHLTARRMLDWAEENEAPSAEQVRTAIDRAASAWGENCPKDAMRARITASLALQQARRGAIGQVALITALGISPTAAIAQLAWAVPGALRGWVYVPTDR